jgi:hypothetical protein
MRGGLTGPASPIVMVVVLFLVEGMGQISGFLSQIFKIVRSDEWSKLVHLQSSILRRS